MSFILSLDQGTTSSRAILFDPGGHVVAIAQKEFQQIYPKPSWVEHDAEEIWQSVLSSLQEALSNVKDSDFSVKKMAGSKINPKGFRSTS